MMGYMCGVSALVRLVFSPSLYWVIAPHTLRGAERYLWLLLDGV